MGIVFLLLGTGLFCAAVAVDDRSGQIALGIGAALNFGAVAMMIINADPNFLRLLPAE